MSGHYEDAVKDLHVANGTNLDDPMCQYVIARAQMHATLALVDAVKDLGASTGRAEP